MGFFERVRYYSLRGACIAVGALPDSFLYHFMVDLIYFILYRIAGYRIKVVRENLKNSFPEKDPAQLREIERGFYYHLAEVFIDAIDLVGISEKSFRERLVIENLEEHNAATEGRDWIAAMAHYGSWEYFTAYQFYTDSEVVAVYKPLHSKVVDKLYYDTRSKFGARPVPMNELLRYILKRENGRNYGVGLIADQAPLKTETHWVEFLNQKTTFFMGVEKIALKFGMPVYFTRLVKTGRAHYRARFDMIYDGVESVPEGEIARRYAGALEEMIREKPQYWMWSHRRWKHRRIIERMASGGNERNESSDSAPSASGGR